MLLAVLSVSSVPVTQNVEVCYLKGFQVVFNVYYTVLE
jgi:hypothetical protein